MFDNSPTSITGYPCPSHPNEKVTHVCSEATCTQAPYLCQYCLAESAKKLYHGTHEQSLVPIADFLRDTSSRIQSSKLQMHRIYISTLGRRQHEPLLKKLQQLKNGALSDTVNSLKLQVERQSEMLLQEFQRRLQSTKQMMFQQLDAYLSAHAANLQAYKQLTDPLINFDKKVKHYSNPNCLSMKVLSELKRRSNSWTIELKRYMGGATKLLADKQSTAIQLVNKATNQVQCMMDEVPVYRTFQNNEIKGMRVQAFINEQLHDRLVVEEVKPLGVEPQEVMKIQTVMTPTSTATSGLSSQRDISNACRSPIQIEERRYNRTVTELNSGSANNTRTVIRTNRLS